MKFHCVVLDPMLGWSDNKLTQGAMVGNLIAAHVIDLYLRSVNECLEHLGITTYVLETRRKPGLKAEARLNEMGSGKLGIRCDIGFEEDKKDIAYIGYNCKELEELAKVVSAFTNKWASGHNPYHKWTAPTFEESSTQPHIILQPFNLYNIAAFKMTEEMNISALGKGIGIAIEQWLKKTNPNNVGFRPRQLFEKDWQKQTDQT